MKLLSICIPTYKRQENLRRCIASALDQVEKFGLSGDVAIYVVDDASPDDTKTVLAEFSHLDYFLGISRQQNLGMNQNIKAMLQEAAAMSRFQLILTDDDYLQPDCLQEIVEFLHQFDGEEAPAAIWTPRYSYTEDGELHAVLCSPFNRDVLVKPSVSAAARYMENGFVLSGLIVRAEKIDFDFWETYRDNAYFPAIFFGDFLLRSGAQYWHRSIAHHTVLNECHWERWGKNDVVITLRLFSDFIEAYRVLALKLPSVLQRVQFRVFSLSALHGLANGSLTADAMRGGTQMLSDAVIALKAEGRLRIGVWLRLLLSAFVTIHVFAAAFKVVLLALLWILRHKKASCVTRLKAHWTTLLIYPDRLRLMLNMVW